MSRLEIYDYEEDMSKCSSYKEQKEKSFMDEEEKSETELEETEKEGGEERVWKEEQEKYSYLEMVDGKICNEKQMRALI